MRPPTHHEHKRFCEIDGWEEKRGGKDHFRYGKRLDDDRYLRTRVSHGSGGIDDQNLWRQHILRVELEVTESQFWEALESGDPVDRTSSAPDPQIEDEPPPPLEGWLVSFLINLAGLTDDEIRQLTPDEAMARYLEWCESEDRR
jgi:hypothetical protein